jgi:hypothetical protein
VSSRPCTRLSFGLQADFYTFPHVILFDSWEDLVTKLQTTDLRAVSAAMQEHNARQVRVRVRRVLSNRAAGAYDVLFWLLRLHAAFRSADSPRQQRESMMCVSGLRCHGAAGSMCA